MGVRDGFLTEYMFITLERFKGGIGRHILKLSTCLAVPILLHFPSIILSYEPSG